MQTASEQKRIEKLKVEMGLAKEEKRRKKKTGNPNPLSCLKSKKKPVKSHENPLRKVQDKLESEGKQRTTKQRKRNRKKKTNNSSTTQEESEKKSD
jgi:hypothetical protein